jgi:putative zinc finger protein
MTHNQISEGTIERYVRRELAEEERRSFEEHLLDCPECFEEVQIMERFVAGVRNAARTGSLASAISQDRTPWLAVALAAGLAVALIGGGWWVRSLERSVDESLAARDGLARQLAQAMAAAEHPLEIRAGNLPIAVLRADRAAGSATLLRVPPSAREIALWMDVEPGHRYPSFSVTLQGEGSRSSETLRGLTRNGDGAISIVLPASKLPTGRYTVQLSSEQPVRLLAQYNLQIAVP